MLMASAGAQGATPPESGGELLKNSPPQMRRGGAPSAGVVMNRIPEVVRNRKSGVALTRGKEVALRMTGLSSLSAACKAPPFRSRPTVVISPD
jgi:hypothetical protein